MTEQISIVPLAITLDGAGAGCVAGFDCVNNQWIRPEPIMESDVIFPAGQFEMFQPCVLMVNDPNASDARPEDRSWLREHGVIHQGLLKPEARRRLLERICDQTVETAFRNQRSIGVIRVRILEMYIGRSTGRRAFHRLRFVDASDETFDWIVRDVRVLDAFSHLDSPEGQQRLCAFSDSVTGTTTYISIGLTKPNYRFPGRFRGCHPLVVGLFSDLEISSLADPPRGGNSWIDTFAV